MRKMALLLGMFLIIVFVFIITVSYAQTTITLQQGVNGYTQGKDTFITQLWGGNDNLGGHEALECNKDDDDIGRILVYFSLSERIPEEVIITESWLELYNFDEEWDDEAEEVSAYRMTADWVEGSGTKDTIEDTPDQSGAYWGHSGYASWNGGVFDFTLLDRIMLPGRPGISSDGGWFSWTITEAVQAWHTGSAPNYGIILRGDGYGQGATHYFWSNEYSDPSLRPRLVITYTVNGTTNHSPTCEAGNYSSFVEGATVNLTGTASDLDGDPLTYLWARVSGPSITILNATYLEAHFEAPEVDAAGATVVVRLTVNDGRGGMASDDADIFITDSTGPSGALIIDHTCTDISQVPANRIEAAKSNLRIWYGHTSHGSQITSGMEAMANSLFSFNSGPGSLSYEEATGVDLGYEGDLDWRNITIDQLNQPANDRNVVMWSWCGGVSDNTESGINVYLHAMDQLETDYPGVTFIYMTGHLDGTGETGNLHIRNNQIRDYCRANNKILFDFADIESYDPDGNYYLDRLADDNCSYYEGGEPRNWAQEWCAANPGECSSYDCAHSQSLNCDLKARAFWWMLAGIAGWDPDNLDPNVIRTKDMDIAAGWSMISIPLRLENASVSSLFPDAVVTYGYEKEVGYERVMKDGNLVVGRGYWIMFNTAQSHTLTGKPILNYKYQVDEDGWAMIGGCTSDAKVSHDTCSIGVIYRYVQGDGYQQVPESEALKPCEGYWILLNNVTGQAELRVEVPGGPE